MSQEATTTVSSPWDSDAPAAASRLADDVTLVEGQTFCISDPVGDMSPSQPNGLFFLDTRFVSRFELRLDGNRFSSVGIDFPLPFAATFATRVVLGDTADAGVVAFRRRHVGRGLRERLTITNYQLEPIQLVLELAAEADFADLFAVKENRAHGQSAPACSSVADELSFAEKDEANAKRTHLRFSQRPEIDTDAGQARWDLSLKPHESWELCVEVTVEVDGSEVETRFPCDPDKEDDASGPAERLASWQARLPNIETSHEGLGRSVRRSGDDLGALRIFDPEHPDVPIVAAGAPWFMTIFGRDSLLTAWMTLLADASLAGGVLETLARFQGSEVNPDNEEEPGKILHEMRFSTAEGVALSGGRSYYGTIDATPLFVMLLAEARRWGLADQQLEALLPHADRALEWIEQYGDLDGDGYVEYRSKSDQGLANQGWKDSWDAIRFGDTTLAEAPIALCEVQGYVYAAYQARAALAREAGDHATDERCRRKAADLRERFNQDFWMEEQGIFALGLDADKRCIDAVASNAGHCLWTGIVEPERAARVADRLLRDDMCSGWGIRTLASSMPAYNPVSYHNGSVWPHDNALSVAGLVRYGFVEHAHRVIEGQLAAAAAHGDRLPELFAGFGRDDLPVPGSYPSACSPQAWATAAPLLWLRSLLRLDPDAPRGLAWVAPDLPDSIRQLSVHGINIGNDRLDIDVEDGQTHVSASNPRLQIQESPRPEL